jgi:hypothetical protein
MNGDLELIFQCAQARAVSLDKPRRKILNLGLYLIGENGTHG